jgi:hypothetical protein
VLVALTVLATVGSAALWTVSESLRALARAHEHEAHIEQANHLLIAATLWRRVDLDQRLGRRRQGPFWMRIDRRAPAVYDIEVTDTATGHLLLATALYRREDAR